MITPYGPKPQAATFIVAASDSLHKERADYVCDGVDDQVEIQAAIDALTSGRTRKEKVLIMGNFTIDKAIKLPSYTVLEIIGKIKLADNANDYIIKNADFVSGNSNIEVRGGVLDGNGVNQTRNLVPGGYFGHAVYFRNVSNLVIENLTVKNPNAWSIRLQKIVNAYVHNINFDCDGSTPNQDGIDILGGETKNIIIDGVMGVTKDNTITLFPNANTTWNDGVHGNIHDVHIANVAMRDVPYELIRFYSADETEYVDGVSITNVGGYNVRGLIGNFGALVYRCVLNGASLFIPSGNNLFYFSSGTNYDFNLENIRAYVASGGWGSTSGFTRLRMKNVILQVGSSLLHSENSGTATITAGQTSVDVTHGLADTPTRVVLTPTTDTAGKRYWISAKGATTFTITIDSTHTADISFDWRAIVGEG